MHNLTRDPHPAREAPDPVPHDGLQSLESFVARTVARIENRPGIRAEQPYGKSGQLFRRLIGFLPFRVQQVKTAKNGMDGPGTGFENILETIVGAAREEKTIGIQGHFMTEIIRNGAAITFPQQVAVTRRDSMGMRDPGDDMDASGNLR